MGHTVASLARRVIELEQLSYKLENRVGKLEDLSPSVKEVKKDWRKGLSPDMYIPVPADEYGTLYCEVEDCPTLNGLTPEDADPDTDACHAQWQLDWGWELDNYGRFPDGAPEYMCSMHYYELVNYDPNANF